MPTVPVYSTQETPSLDSSITGTKATAQAFGSGVGTAISGFGDAVSNAGKVIDVRVKENQSRVNKSAADEATMEWQIAQGTLDNAHKSLEGRARIDDFPQYVEKSRELRDEFKNGLKNPETTNLFESATRGYLSTSIRSASNGAASEIKRYNEDSTTKLLTASHIAVQNNPDSDETFNQSLTNAGRALGQRARDKGWTQDEIKEKLNEQQSSLLASRYSALGQTDPERALKLYGENKDKILPDDRKTIEAKIATGKHTQGSKAALEAHGLKNALNSDINSILKTGEGVQDLQPSKVEVLLGQETAASWRGARDDAQQMWSNTYNLATMPSGQMDERLRELTPKPGSQTFEREQKIYDYVKIEAERVQSLRQNDPASSVASDPSVAQAIQSNDPTFIMNARLAAQDRAGIPQELQSPITMREALDVMTPVMRALPGQERVAFEQVAKGLKDKYGDEWEGAFKYALRAQKLSNERAMVGTNVLNKLMKDEELTPSDTTSVDKRAEGDATQKAVDDLKPKVKEPISKRILDKMPGKRSALEDDGMEISAQSRDAEQTVDLFRKPLETVENRPWRGSETETTDQEALDILKTNRKLTIRLGEEYHKMPVEERAERFREGDIEDLDVAQGMGKETLEKAKKKFDELNGPGAADFALEKGPEGMSKFREEKRLTHATNSLKEFGVKSIDEFVKKIPVDRIAEVLASPTDAVLEDFDEEFGDGASAVVSLHSEQLEKRFKKKVQRMKRKFGN